MIMHLMPPGIPYDIQLYEKREKYIFLGFSFWELKEDLEIYFFYLRKLSWFLGKFFSTALVIDTLFVKYCSNAVLYNLPQSRDILKF